ncbi:MAG: putative 2OG-Fe(II) oxygenase [Pseudomonadota bacterium]
MSTPPGPERKPQIVGLFPTPVMQVPGVVQGVLLGQIVERIRAEKRTANVHDARLSHSTPVEAGTDPLFSQVARRVAGPMAEFGVALFGERLEWHIKEIWTNVLAPGGHQAMHNHANSFISGIVYLTPFHPKSGTVFHRAFGGTDFAFVNQNSRARMGPFNASRWQAPQMQPGDMVLFPSYMQHEVPVNEGAERITLAFNALPDRLDSWGYSVRFS